jgi:hypothetical protein
VSIYATWLALSDDEHEESCAVYVETRPDSGIFEFSGEPCDCGLPGAPIVYQGSHVLPSDDDARGGSVDVAAIPSFIVRDGRDDAQGEGLKDWLRLSVDADGDAVVLTRRHVRLLRDTLTEWLDAEERA